MTTNRHICSVFEEMRDCCKTLNFSYLLGLIEEAQSMANRMEASLYDKNDYERVKREYKELKKKVKKLKKEEKILEKKSPPDVTGTHD